ncbi:unnamed protein product, partial [Pylaiella littoralis]
TLGNGCGPGSDGNVTGCVPSAGVDNHRTFVGRFYRWCEECGEASDRKSDFYEYSGIPTLNGSRPTLALPPNYTAKGLCRHVCLSCDTDGEIAALATTYPAGDRLSG